MSVDIRERLADLRIEVAPDTAAVHLGTIAEELRSPSPIPPRRYRRRRLPVVVVAVLLLVALSAAGAIAAEQAVPGDRLYPVKQATEWVRSWIDPTIPADHRIDELETLLDRRAAHEAIADQLRRAEEAVADATVGDPALDAPLVERFDHVVDRVPLGVIAREVSDEPTVSDERDATLLDRPRDTEGGEGDRLGSPRDREATLAELCNKVAASENWAEEFPAWLLRRCRNVVDQAGDSDEIP